MAMIEREEFYRYNLSVMKLYIRFLKEEKLFGNVYRTEHKIPPLRKVMNTYTIDVSHLSNTYTYMLLGNGAKHSDGLVHSQLWRGFVLDNIGFLDFISDEHKRKVIKNVECDLCTNGTRGDERVIEILEKYNIRVITTSNE